MTGYNYYYDCNYQSVVCCSNGPLYVLAHAKPKKMRSLCANSPMVSPFEPFISIGNAERNNVNYRWLFLVYHSRLILGKKRRKKRNIRYMLSFFLKKKITELWTDINRKWAEILEFWHCLISSIEFPILFESKSFILNRMVNEMKWLKIK